MLSFKHIILTRFNVRIFAGIYDHDVNSPEWLDERFDLFEQFTFPSMVSQSNLNFKWLVFFDKELPQRYLERIEKFSAFSNFFAIFLRGYDLDAVLATVREQAGDETILVTTRVDSDDALTYDFVESVQNIVRKGSHPCFINFSSGYLYESTRRYLYRITDYYYNPFISFVEPLGEKIQTIYYWQHQMLKNNPLIRNYDGHPRWCIVVHGGNLRNQPTGNFSVADITPLFPGIKFNYKRSPSLQFLVAGFKHRLIKLWKSVRAQ
jgi:hypothetical protein